MIDGLEEIVVMGCIDCPFRDGEETWESIGGTSVDWTCRISADCRYVDADRKDHPEWCPLQSGPWVVRI